MSKDIEHVEAFPALKENLHVSLLMFFFKNTVKFPALDLVAPLLLSGPPAQPKTEQ